MQQTLVVYVDVDDTLIRHAGTRWIPISSTVRQVRQLHDDGAVLYCWSTGGADHAREAATFVGLADCFEAFLPKPNLVVDDQPVGAWRRCIELAPNELIGRTLDDHRTTLGR